MKNIILCLLFIAMTININAQLKGGAGFFKTGYLFAPGSSAVVNKIISDASASITNNNYMIIGIEGYYRTGKSIISCDGYTAQQAIYSLENNSSKEPFISSAQIKLGRIVKENKQYWLYPTMGIGATAFTLYSFREVNKSTVNDMTVTLLTPSADIGINADILIEKVDGNKKRFGGSMLAIRAGYRTSARSNNWTYSHSNQLLNLPYYSNNCFYLSVSIGAGGFVRK
jgi:hypothetical protein